jgi:Fe-S oxidoreductase
MGLVPWWARLATRAPRLVNALLATPGLSHVLRAAGGITTRRPLPRFAPTTFRARMKRRRRGADRAAGGRPVLLYVDTFTDAFDPAIGESAVDVLEAAGFAVELTPPGLCCGRPLYDFGLLGLARRLLRDNVAALAPRVREGVPVVALEPSCVATFRDELPALFPADAEALAVSAGFVTLAELLASRAPEWDPPRRAGTAVVQGHCHHKAVMGMGADLQLLARTGLEVVPLDVGCCGLAGSFGFEASHYELSMACGELQVLPAIRGATDALVLADGFSCRHQIAHGTGRRALHLAEVLRERAAATPA